MTTQALTPTLLSPFDLAGLPLKNRVVMAPLTRGRAGKERIPNALMAEYYAQRASVGLIISEATTISKQANGWLNSPGIYSEEQTQAWKQVVDAVHAKETPFFLQLWHTGRASHSSFQENGQLPVSASAFRLTGDYSHTPIGKQPYETPRALETNGIPLIVADYRQAAQRAKEAGFDGVEIHAGHGYLIDQFLQSKTNQRTDQYGGSLENRYRFLKEIIEAILTVFPASRVGVRLSPNSAYNDMGSPDFRETFLYVAQQLNRYSLGYLALIDGLEFNGFHELGEPMGLAEFRDAFTGAIMANSGYTQETASAAIEAGNADLVGFGRPIISNPDLVERFANGWSLNPPTDTKVWYSLVQEGYTDFPAYSESQDSSDRIEAVNTYFRKVNTRDSTVLNLFTDDVQLFFPKFGLAHGKDALVKFSEIMMNQLERIEHDIEAFNYIVSGNFVVVEGTERGVMRGGLYCPDGIVSQGRFCNVFEFDGALIRRIYIYVDPDFTSADRDRIQIFQGEQPSSDVTRNVVKQYFDRLQSGAEPEAIAALFSEDVDWDITGDVNLVPWIGTRKGRRGVANFIRDLREQDESIRLEIRSIVVEGEKAVVLGEFTSQIKKTGKVIESEFALEFAVQNSLIVRYRLFEDTFAVAQAAQN
ncbi:nuclear transport factor 2 family protein [Phormidium tenue FACHB-886]|nr:nuclear transport factor 2 family protein [Phormidium tenue FACHB-886]